MVYTGFDQTKRKSLGKSKVQYRPRKIAEAVTPPPEPTPKSQDAI
jgi:hypothetical protein